jgi:hypothetical protein
MMHRFAHKMGIGHCPECETLVEFAMEGLPKGQQDKVRRHLEDCPPCREQVRDFWQVREGLGLCAQQKEPPADLAAKVLARLGETERENGGRTLRRGADPLEGWPRFWLFVGPIFALLSVVLSAVALFSFVGGKAAPLAPANEIAALSNDLLNEASAVRVRLEGSGADGFLVLAPGRDRAYLSWRAAGTQAPPAGVYELWMARRGNPAERIAVFAAPQGGSVEFLHLKGPLGRFAQEQDFWVAPSGEGRAKSILAGELRQ